MADPITITTIALGVAPAVIGVAAKVATDLLKTWLGRRESPTTITVESDSGEVKFTVRNNMSKKEIDKIVQILSEAET